MKKFFLAALAAASLSAGYALAQSWDVTYSTGFTTAQDSGITAARNAYNTANPQTPITTNSAYVQFVMTKASQSYCTQYGVSGC